MSDRIDLLFIMADTNGDYEKAQARIDRVVNGLRSRLAEYETGSIPVIHGKEELAAHDEKITAALRAQLSEQSSRTQVLEKQLAEAKRVIEWYANTENWDVEAGTCHDMKPKGLQRKLYKVLDLGQKAREFLERKGK